MKCLAWLRMLESGVWWVQSKSRGQAFGRNELFLQCLVSSDICREIKEEEKCTVTSCRKVLWPTHQTSWRLTHCGFLKLQMWIHAIIMIWYIFVNCNWVDTRWQQYSMCEGQWNTEFVLTYHTLGKIWNIIFKRKLVIFQNQLHFLSHKACLKAGNRQSKAVL
jgi:hypothetical protein